MSKILISLAVLFSAASFAQTTAPTAAERSKAAVDAAYSQALMNQQNAAKNSVKDLPAPFLKDMRNAERADPLAVAKSYQGKVAVNLPPKQDLLIFISTSMPQRTLELLGNQAVKTGAVLVLRGLVGKIGTSTAIEETMKAIQPVAMTGAAIQIDPTQFSAYNVTVVPTFVMAKREEGCTNKDQCASTAYALTGDVSLEYALETWVNRGGDAGRLANMYLKKLTYSRQ